MPRYYAEVEKTMFELAKAFDEETSMQKNIKIISLMQTLGHKALNIIKRNATADVQEVKHGKWEYKQLDNFRKYMVICPFCKREYVDNYDGYIYANDFNYCPNCGAKMDGKD